MPQAVTELVIDADTSGADRFSDAMDRSGEKAQSAQQSVAQMTLAIAGVGIAVVGAVAGLRSFVDYVGNQTQQLVDLSDRADRAGMSVTELQQSLFAARSAGISDKDFFSGIDKITSDLAQAGQQATEFGKLFEANGLKIKDQNGQLISTRQALTGLVGLMSDAAPQIQQRIAQIVGVSASWIPFLKQGEDQFEAMKQKAADLGVIIDSDTIAKAQEFNAQWKEAVATWDLQFKASLASILPLLTQLATIASQVIAGIGSVSGTIGRWLTPVDQQNSGQLSQTIDDLHRLREQVEAIGGVIDRNNGFAGMKAAGTASNMFGLPDNASLKDIDAMLDRLQSKYDSMQGRLRVTPNQSSGSTVLPNMGGKDDVDKATDAIERQIAKLQADAEAAGKGAGELERLRVEAQLYAAAERAGITDTEKFADRFYNLAERAGQAAEALAKAKVGAEIRFGSQTALLSPDELQIATRLKDIYPNVATALNSVEAAQMRFNKTLKDGSDAFQNAAAPALLDFETGAKKGSDAVKALEQQFVKSLLNMANQALIFGPISKALQGAVSGFSLTSLFASAHGNVFAGGNVVPFAQGGVVDSPTLAPMALFGEAGPEAIVPLRRDANGNLGVGGGSGGGTSIVYHINASGADSGTVLRIEQVLAAHAKAIGGQGKALKSANRKSRTGVD